MRTKRINRKILKIISAATAFIFVFSVVSPGSALAGRSSAGGGELSSFDVGKFVMTAGISVASIGIGAAIGSGVNSTLQGGNVAASIGSSLSSGFMKIGGLAQNYNTFVAVSGVGRAVGMAGSYNGWDPSTTFIVSGVATGMTAGALNPSTVAGGAISNTALTTSGSAMLKGVVVGGMTSLASGGTIVAIDGDKINKGDQLGVVAQIAGFTAGITAANVSQKMLSSTTYTERDHGVIRRESITQNNTNQQTTQPVAQQGGSEKIGTSATQSTTQPTTQAMPKDTLGQYNFYEVKSTDAFNSTKPTETPISNQDVKAWIDNPNIEFRPTGDGNYVKVVETNATLSGAEVGKKVFVDAMLVKTGDMWPQIATRSLSILATNSLSEKNKWLSPLANSTVEGVAGPFISVGAEYYALKPGYYAGGDKTANSIEHNERMWQTAYTTKLNKIGSEAYSAYKNAGGNQMQLNSALQDVLNKNGINNVQVANVTDKDSLKNIVAQDLQRAGKNELEINAVLQKIEQSFPNTKIFNPQTATLGATLNRAGVAVQAQLKKIIKSGGSIDKGFAEVAGTSRFSSFLRNYFNEARFGLIEGKISGGISSLAGKYSENDPLATAAAVYGATLVSGAIRGAVLNAFWEPSVKNNSLMWMNKYSWYKPQAYSGDDAFAKKVNQYSYPKEAERFNELGRDTNLSLAEQPRTVYTKTTDGDMQIKTEQVAGYELTISNEKPPLFASILSGMGQANREFLNRSLSFGAPQLKPEQMTAINTVDYLSQMRSYGFNAGTPGWFVRAFTSSDFNSSYTNAGATAIGNNMLGTIAATPAANTFFMQRQRLVLTKGTFVNGYNPSPVTIQSLDYKPWALGVDTRIYLPYPSDSYRGGRSLSGKNYLRDK